MKNMNKLNHLPPPQYDLDFPLMKALKKRRTKRKWIQSDFTKQELSNLLWAACGTTYKETIRTKSRRTAPSACNTQEIKVYIALSYGLFRYDEINHQLIEILSTDIREYIGTQRMMKSAPLGLIYVSDFSKFKRVFFGHDDNKKWFTSTADTGFISQNVYLYSAAENWNTALLSLVDREKLHKIMKLSNNDKIIYTQVIGKAN